MSDKDKAENQIFDKEILEMLGKKAVVEEKNDEEVLHVELPYDFGDSHSSVVNRIKTLLDTPNVTDIHITETRNLWIRKDGDMIQLPEICPEGAIGTVSQRVFVLPVWDRSNASATYKDLRVRLRFSKTLTRKQLFIRLLPGRAPDISKLGYRSLFEELLKKPRPGLVLIAGATGSGKSTLLASLLQHFSDTQPVHLCSVEDPVEYVIQDGVGEVSQREFPEDVKSFDEGIRDVLREDPDIILVGEMRDAPTAKACLTAAETGHMVFGTIHASSVAGIVDRFLGMVSDIPDVEMRFADAFLGGIHLELARNADGDMERRCHIAWKNDSMSEAIRSMNYHMIQCDSFAVSPEKGAVSLSQANG